MKALLKSKDKSVQASSSIFELPKKRRRGTSKVAGKRIQSQELKQSMYEINKLQHQKAKQDRDKVDIEKASRVPYNLRSTSLDKEAEYFQLKRSQRYIAVEPSAINKSGIQNPPPIFSSALMIAESIYEPPTMTQGSPSTEALERYLEEVYKEPPVVPQKVEANEIPYLSRNTKIIQKLKAKRAKEEEKKREEEQKKREEEAAQKREPPTVPHVDAREEAKAPRVSEGDKGPVMARRYLEFRTRVTDALSNGTLRESEYVPISDTVNQTFNSMAKTNYQEKRTDLLRLYQQVTRSGNTSLQQYFFYITTKVLYPQIKENSKTTAKENPGRDMIIVYAQLFTQLSAPIPGLIGYLVSFCFAKCPLLIPDVHPLGISEQQYRIQRKYKDPIPQGEDKRFHDSIRFRGKRLRGMAIFYCNLVKLNPDRCLGQAWISLCKLLNSPVVNHTPSIVDTYLSELGETFARYYRVQYEKLLMMVEGEYANFLNNESAKLMEEGDVFRLRVDSLRYVAQEQLKKFFNK